MQILVTGAAGFIGSHVAEAAVLRDMTSDPSSCLATNPHSSTSSAWTQSSATSPIPTSPGAQWKAARLCSIPRDARATTGRRPRISTPT